MNAWNDDKEIAWLIPARQYCRYCDNLAVHAFTIYCEGGKRETGYKCQECHDEDMEQARFEYREKKGE